MTLANFFYSYNIGIMLFLDNRFIEQVYKKDLNCQICNNCLGFTCETYKSNNLQFLNLLYKFIL